RASARRRRSIHGANSRTASSAARAGARRGTVTSTAPSLSTLTRTRRAREAFEVYINGVRQQPGVDYEIRGRELVFDRPLAKEGRLGFWRWFWGAWGIGTYRKNDQVDVTWEVDGRPRVAHALDIEPPAPTG